MVMIIRKWKNHDISLYHDGPIKIVISDELKILNI